MKIDVHTHFYPKVYLDELRKESRVATITTDDKGRTLLKYQADYNIVDPSHVDPEIHVKLMEEACIDMQVISLTTPGIHLEEKERAVEIARSVNNAMADLVKTYPTKFRAMCSLPTQDPKASVAELDRAVRHLGLSGAEVLTSVGENLTLDSREYWPLFELAQELDVPIFIHPTCSPDVEGMKGYRVVPLVGFCMNTTLVATRLVFAGVLEQFPRLKIILSHMGGAVPYLAERIDRGWRAYPECKVNISKSPIEYLKMFYMDSINFDPDALMFGLKFAGPDKVLLGSDHPHLIGSLSRCVPAITSLPISEEDKQKILGGNAKALFKIA